MTGSQTILIRTVLFLLHGITGAFAGLCFVRGAVMNTVVPPGEWNWLVSLFCSVFGIFSGYLTGRIFLYWKELFRSILFMLMPVFLFCSLIIPQSPLLMCLPAVVPFWAVGMLVRLNCDETAGKAGLFIGGAVSSILVLFLNLPEPSCLYPAAVYGEMNVCLLLFAVSGRIRNGILRYAAILAVGGIAGFCWQAGRKYKPVFPEKEENTVFRGMEKENIPAVLPECMALYLLAGEQSGMKNILIADQEGQIRSRFFRYLLGNEKNGRIEQISWYRKSNVPVFPSLQKKRHKYDLICIHLSYPGSVAEGLFYSGVFFRRARELLMPNGILAVFLPRSAKLPDDSNERFRQSTAASLCREFSSAGILNTRTGDYLIGSMRQSVQTDPDSINRKASHLYSTLHLPDDFLWIMLSLYYNPEKNEKLLSEAWRNPGLEKTDFAPVREYIPLLREWQIWFGLPLVLYLLMRYFCIWKPVHKQEFAAFENGILQSGGILLGIYMLQMSGMNIQSAVLFCLFFFFLSSVLLYIPHKPEPSVHFVQRLPFFAAFCAALLLLVYQLYPCGGCVLLLFLTTQAGHRTRQSFRPVTEQEIRLLAEQELAGFLVMIPLTVFLLLMPYGIFILFAVLAAIRLTRTIYPEFIVPGSSQR